MGSLVFVMKIAFNEVIVLGASKAKDQILITLSVVNLLFVSFCWCHMYSLNT